MYVLRTAIVLAVLVSALQPPSGQLRIVEPSEGSYVTGPTVLRAAIDAGGIAGVVFFVDGVEVCRMRQPPFECTWDAGAVIKAHDIRVVANLEHGRIVKTIRTKGTDYVDQTEVSAVRITATVEDDGHFVRDLPQGAFHVFEDGVAQTITGFATSDVPLDLVVAVDISGSMGLAMPQVKAAVREFLNAVPGKDRVTLLGFNDNVFTLARSVTDPAVRVAAVDGLKAWGLTALYDAIVESVDLLRDAPGRKAVIVFTDGEDRASHVTLDQTGQRLEESDATLFMIGEGRGAVAGQLKSLMSRLTAPTGGRAIFTDDIGKLRDIFRELLSELSNQYLLTYAPPGGTARQGWHTITVKVDGHKHVRARQGYRVAGPDR